MDKYLQEAIETYERHVDSQPLFYMDAPTLLDIVDHYQKNGMAFEAERCLRFARRLHPDDPEVLATMAFLLKVNGKWTEARELIRHIPRDTCREAELIDLEWEIAQGFPDKASKRLQELKQSLGTGTDYWDWCLDLAEILMDYGYNERAKAMLLEVERSYPDYHRVAELLADAAQQLGQLDEAEAFTNLMLEADPYDAEQWAQLADIQQKGGRNEESLGSAEYALAINPQHRMGMSLKVYNTFALGRTEEALKLVKKFSPLMPDDMSMAMYAAEQLFNERRLDEALPYARKALANCPFNSPDRNRLQIDVAMILAFLHRPKEAEEALLATSTTGATMQEIYFRLYMLEEKAGDAEAAIATLVKFCALPGLTDEELGEAYTALHQHRWYAQAAAAWEQLRQRHVPATGHCRTILAYAFHELHDADEFLKQLKLALKEEPFVAYDVFSQLLKPFTDSDEMPLHKEDFIPLALRDIASWRQKDPDE